ncbi:hypothetical protein Ct61P_10486 [Colletotrichum tofieldiae]|nr:hypothetical protein Ct61P_10486 [Colletotrichum tofieldiae]
MSSCNGLGLYKGLVNEHCGQNYNCNTYKSEILKEKYANKVPAYRPGKDEDIAVTMLFFTCNQYLNG